MHKRLRSQLSYANVMVTILAFAVFGGGTALAAFVISSNSQVGPGTISGHGGSAANKNIIPSSVNATDLAGASVGNSKLASGAVTSAKVADQSLTGADIADRSGVDTCQAPLTAKLGPICAGSDGIARDWGDAVAYCAGFGLTLPSLGEAVAMAKNYNVPGTDKAFWTDDVFSMTPSTGANAYAYVVNDAAGGVGGTIALNNPMATVCVTDPSA